MAFSKEELEEMRRADEEIEREFRITQDEIVQSRLLDRNIALDALPQREKRLAEYKKAYREANREQIAEYKKAYYEANREQIAEKQKAYYEANREQIAEKQKWITDERKARRLTQYALAKALGVSQPCIALLERGKLRLDCFKKAKELYTILGK